MKIVGLREISGTNKKTQRPFSAVVVSAVGPVRDTIGEGVCEQFVDHALFDASTSGQDLAKLIGHECSFVYDRNGFLAEFTVK